MYSLIPISSYTVTLFDNSFVVIMYIIISSLYIFFYNMMMLFYQLINIYGEGFSFKFISHGGVGVIF